MKFTNTVLEGLFIICLAMGGLLAYEAYSLDTETTRMEATQ